MGGHLSEGRKPGGWGAGGLVRNRSRHSKDFCFLAK